jgi:hypothetical protein
VSFPNTITDIIATTIESRSKKIADNVTNNNAVLKKLSMRGKIKTFSGGHKIIQEMSFAENGNAGWYSGYDILPTAQQDVIGAAEFNIRQAAVPVTMSGLEDLQNSGPEQMIDLMEGRLGVAEATMANLLADGAYSDGTADSGKQIEGLEACLPLANTTGTYGSINRATYSFWQHQIQDASGTGSIQSDMNTLWAKLVRGADRPDLILMDNTAWLAYMASLQSQQRFMDPKVGNLGFPTLKFMDADVCLDGGIYSFSRSGVPTGTAFFLNCTYLHWRPHARRNMVPLNPSRRYAYNQDAEVQILAFAGNLTSSGNKFQGRLDVNS